MNQETTRNLLRRLKSIEGHVGGVIRMVENHEYCIDIVNQVLAVERALEKVNALILDQHLHTCVTRAMRGSDKRAREQVIGEILQLWGKKQ